MVVITFHVSNSLIPSKETYQIEVEGKGEPITSWHWGKKLPPSLRPSKPPQLSLFVHLSSFGPPKSFSLSLSLVISSTLLFNKYPPKAGYRKNMVILLSMIPQPMMSSSLEHAASTSNAST